MYVGLHLLCSPCCLSVEGLSSDLLPSVDFSSGFSSGERADCTANWACNIFVIDSSTCFSWPSRPFTVTSCRSSLWLSCWQENNDNDISAKNERYTSFDFKQYGYCLKYGSATFQVILQMDSQVLYHILSQSALFLVSRFENRDGGSGMSFHSLDAHL